jgi:predicted anti-sigma-YlaC factor YlaD
VAALFLLAWMRDIVPALLTNTTPATILEAKLPTNPVYVLDLGFLIPLSIAGAVWLLRRSAWGYLLAGLLPVLNALLSLSIISSTLFQYANDRSTSLAVIPLFGIIALASVVLAIRYLAALQEGSG